MTTWKVWFNLSESKFALEFKGEFNDVCEAATNLAKKLGSVFDYELDEVREGK